MQILAASYIPSYLFQIRAIKFYVTETYCSDAKYMRKSKQFCNDGTLFHWLKQSKKSNGKNAFAMIGYHRAAEL